MQKPNLRSLLAGYTPHSQSIHDSGWVTYKKLNASISNLFSKVIIVLGCGSGI